MLGVLDKVGMAKKKLFLHQLFQLTIKPKCVHLICLSVALSKFRPISNPNLVSSHQLIINSKFNSKFCQQLTITSRIMTTLSNNQILNQSKCIWRTAQAVCFDVDSTVIQHEGIDELAKFCGKGDAVAKLTKEAMGGTMDFRQALALRLDIIRPTSTQLRNFILQEKQTLTPYVKELIHELHKRGTHVFLISGGFRSLIEPVAHDLNIPFTNIFANRIKFYFDGDYAGFDESQLTSRSGGKAAVIRHLKDTFGYDKVVMIGDGMTDWEAAPPADLFIGFGGNQFRYEVKNKSKWYVTDFRDLLNEVSN